jgi:hypothetical protein
LWTWQLSAKKSHAHSIGYKETHHEKAVHKMQCREEDNGLSPYQSSRTDDSPLLVRWLHEGILSGI